MIAPPLGSCVAAHFASLVEGDRGAGAMAPPPNMWSCRHLGVYMSYLCVGFIYGAALAIVYPIVIVLNQESNNYQQAVQGAFCFFWSFKVVFGYLSDNVSICGLRRKPYLLMGWMLAISASTALAVIAQLSGVRRICESANRERVDCENRSSVAYSFEVQDVSVTALVLLMCANNFGYVLADVAMDSLVIEYARREPPEDRGGIQGMCYTCRAGGFIVSTALTGFGLNGPMYGGDFDFELSLSTFLWILVGLQCVGLPWWVSLHEERVELPREDSRQTLRHVTDLMRNTAFSKMMLFNVLMNASQTATVNARNSVLSTWVEMSPLAYSMDQVLQYVIMMATLAAAATWLKHFSWRGLLIGGTALYIGIMFLFWLVVFDVVRNQWLVIFIDADQTFAQNIGYLVVMWACVEMAPVGIEGTTLALATSVGNAGQSLGGYLTMGYNAAFALSREDLRLDTEHTRQQYIYNAILVMATQCLYIPFLAWMPNQKQDARQKFERMDNSRVLAFLAMAAVLFAASWGAGTTIAGLFCACSPVLGGSGCIEGVCSTK
eukprot:gnl/TRDRNA2_/TRDRNA2_88849_c0_seq1.p1 gnl/TRDRNA2_/TRDRNA2_88849_c0~~gnl/TRDRNA2_/TRDRNA2_88849_c0_seq1.p1  ORF type:complete len:580 (+),score=73.80 gnl/TRDRNA2_/TRDRNA2_88849_c0_seq1:94-1740(+)